VAQLHQGLGPGFGRPDSNDVVVGMDERSLVTASSPYRDIRLDRYRRPDIAVVLIYGPKRAFGPRTGDLQLVTTLRHQVGPAVQEGRENATGFGASFQVDAAGAVDQNSNHAPRHLNVP
jgi:hypothetical protein